MGNARGVKRDFEELERRRLRAADLLKRGWSQAEVARELGVHRQSVYRWQLALGEQGRAGLRWPGRAGRRPQLTAEHLRELERELKRGPERLGYPSALWTLPRVGQLIEQRFGVRFSMTQVWRILRQLGWTPQRPTGRALERDEAAIRRWKHQRWPELKKTLRSDDRRSSSSTRAG
jgi:transposase